MCLLGSSWGLNPAWAGVYGSFSMPSFCEKANISCKGLFEIALACQRQLAVEADHCHCTTLTAFSFIVGQELCERHSCSEKMLCHPKCATPNLNHLPLLLPSLLVCNKFCSSLCKSAWVVMWGLGKPYWLQMQVIHPTHLCFCLW